MQFDKLWGMLDRQKLTRTGLRLKAGISPSTLAKLGRDEKVSQSVLIKICKALNCEIYDILSYASEPSKNKYENKK